MGITARNSLLSLITIGICCFMFVLVHPAIPDPQPGSDEAALNALVEQFFAAYAKEDLDGFMGLWSENSPDFAKRREIMQQIFADNDNIQVKSLAVVKVKVDGDQAKVRVAVEMTGTDVKTGEPSPIFGKLNRTLHLVKEGSGWKIWRYLPAEQDLADALLAAETKAERMRLLSEDKEMVTAELVRTLLRAGDTQARHGKFPDPLRFNDIAFEVAEVLGDKAELAWCYVYRGLIFGYQSQYPEALENYKRALPLFREAKHKQGEARTLSNIGGVYRSTGKYAEALEAFEESLKLATEIPDKRGEAATLNNIGNVYRSTGKYAEALAQYETSRKIAQEIGDKAMEAQTLHNTGIVYWSTNKYVEALGTFETALKISELIGYIEATFRGYWVIGAVHRAQKQWTQATDAYQKAIALIEQVRAGAKEPSLQMGFFEQYTSPYYGLVTSLLALNKGEEAFQTAERAKARTLVELLEGSRVDITKAMTEEEKQREGELNERIVLANLELRALQSQSNPDQSQRDDVKSRLVAARRDYDAFRRQLYLAHPELQAQRGSFEPLTVSQAAQWLQAQTARDLLVLEYVVGDDQTWLFAFNGTGELAVYPIKLTYKELKGHVNALGEAMREKEKGDQGDLWLLSQLENRRQKLDRLLAPAASVLAGAKQVCIIPDDVLWEVPFAALKTPGGKYLIETHMVFYAPSLTALKAEVEIGKKRRQSSLGEGQHVAALLAMAPFAYPDAEGRNRNRELPLRGTFGALPESEDEVTVVANLFGTKPYLREAATESHTKTAASKARILHFATHVLFEPLQGMYSGILLKEGKGEDGYLEAREIVELDLNADLAVPSACETARGQLSRGEGILGLSWAFFVAGCPSTVVSQWKVADASTAELMKVFYQNLKAGQNKAEALRQAQLSLHNQQPHPYYWAPFILVGDWQRGGQ